MEEAFEWLFRTLKTGFAPAGAGGAVGRSMNLYDAAAGKWRQTCVDMGGGVLEFAGEFGDGAVR